ncbi:hypothetical protein EV361DRAFT_873136 [Lentinula raphanica]|nr:hypothetical protein F5880DRAFT_1506667 [Lentinula raphanica]KAJ3965515.1 hypothetical protein EV361DRAFT_873136 [Lentinula raphanica]
MASNSTELVDLGNSLLFHTSHLIGIIPEMILYGIYTTLFVLSTSIMLQQGLDTPSRKFLLGLTTFMYALTTLYMAASIANIFQLVQTLFFGFSTRNTVNLPMFNAVFLLNYGITDGVVVWRAWVLCRYDYRSALLACILFLCCAYLSEISTIVIRIMLLRSQSNVSELNRAIDITQVMNLGLSLVTNLTATGTVTLKAWRLRKVFYAGPRSPMQLGKMMILIVESGMLYSISLVTILIATVIPLREGTLGDIYTPVNLQLAGIYPLIVLIMVNKNRTLDNVVKVSNDSHPARSLGSFTTIIDTHHSTSVTMVS